jgi:pyridoxamine 5'-phosphate oxidase family protein
VTPNLWPTSSIQTTAVRVFTDAEFRYLTGGRQLGRIATVDADGPPHVVPVGWIYTAARDAIDIGGHGHELERTKKFRDVARSGRAAIVIDDVASTDPWHPPWDEVRRPGRGDQAAHTADQDPSRADRQLGARIGPEPLHPTTASPVLAAVGLVVP